MAREFNLDLDDVFEGLSAMSAAGKDMRPVFRKLVPIAEQDQKETKRKQEDESGRRWDRVARSTREKRLNKSRSRARRRGRKAPKRGGTRLLGKLPTEVRIEFTSTTMLRESRIPWSNVHQEGGTVGRGSKIPARPHVYFSEPFLDRAAEEMRCHLIEAF